MSQGECALEVRDLVVRYPGAARRALDGVTLRVAGAQTLAVVGPSGAGKSTLLRAIAGLVAAEEGDIVLDGTSLIARTPQERRVAVVFAEDALLPHLSVDRNLRLIAREPARIGDVVSALELGALRSRKPVELSSGERRRVSIARALLAQPRALLLDEPLAPLDPELRSLVREELARVRARFEGPMIFVTHDHADAMTVARNLAVLIEGRIEDAGDAQRVYDRPSSLRVAALLGVRPMNVLSGASFGEDSVFLGIRPERVVLSSDGALHGRVQRVERTGADAYVYVQTGAGAIVARVDAVNVPETGVELTCGWEPQHVRRFDRASGAALP